MKRSMLGSKEKKLFIKRFFPAGTYTWVVPNGCTEVDVFLVGAGGGAKFIPSWGSSGGGGGGYTKTFRGKGYVKPSSGTWMGSETEGRDGDAIAVTSGQQIEIIVGAGIAGKDGGYSQFMNSNYRADGGKCSTSWNTGANGGSGGGDYKLNSNGGYGGTDGGDSGGRYGKGQGHTTRDFGEPEGGRNAGGASSVMKLGYNIPGGQSDYTDGTGEMITGTSSDGYRQGNPGGGYGGGAPSSLSLDGWFPSSKGGDGTVLIRYFAYE